MRKVLVVAAALLFATVVRAQSGLEEIDGQGADPYRHYRLDNAGGACVSTGYSIVAVDSDTPPAIPVYASDGVIEPFLIDMTADTCLVGLYGVYGIPLISNLVQRASFKSWDDANTPTGWIETETAGAGAATSSEETSRVAHGGSSAKAVTTAADSSVYWGSVCIDIVDTTTYYFDAWAFGGSGDDDFRILIWRYTDDACTDNLTTTDIVGDQDVPQAWTHYGDVSPAWGTTESIRVIVGFISVATTAWVDVPQMRAASTPTDAGCYADTDATAVCTTGVQSIHQPLAVNGTWTFEATVRSPINGAVGAPYRYILLSPGTGGGNENRVELSWGGDKLYCYFYDASGVLKGTSASAVNNADTDYTVKMYHTSSGRGGCCWDGGTCATEVAGVLMDDISATLYLAGINTAGTDIWVKNPRFYPGLR